MSGYTADPRIRWTEWLPWVAALLIGIADTACKYWVPQFGAFLVYAATIAVLLWRPMGLFGTRT